MAHILPDTPPEKSAPRCAAHFPLAQRAARYFYIWHHLAPWEPNAPDFLLITQDGRALLVKVSPSDPKQTFTAAQLLLTPDDRIPLGYPETAVLTNFVGSLDLPSESLLETLIVFPNISHQLVCESRLGRGVGEPQWAGRELL